MRNVAGVAQTESQKAMDMYNKCRYMDEITGGKGITFATGTPVSNSMTELYTIQRYLQYDRLQEWNWGCLITGPLLLERQSQLLSYLQRVAVIA